MTKGTGATELESERKVKILGSLNRVRVLSFNQRVCQLGSVVGDH